MNGNASSRISISTALATMALAALVLALTVSSVQRAYASATVANSVTYSFTVAANSNSALYTIPGTNTPLTLIGTCKTKNGTVGDVRGVGHIQLVYLDTTYSSDQADMWIGLNRDGSYVQNTVEYSTFDMVFIGTSVSIRNALDAGTGKLTKWLVRNDNGGSVAVTIVIIY